MKAFTVALLAFASAAVADGTKVAPPTEPEFDSVRSRYIHETTGTGGMVHCARFADFHCRRSRTDPAEFRCGYLEMRDGEFLVRKSATLRKDETGWRQLSGDNPRCSVILME